jgi:hypothetical protein
MIVAIIIETFMVYFFVAILAVKGVKEGVNVFKKRPNLKTTAKILFNT